MTQWRNKHVAADLNVVTDVGIFKNAWQHLTGAFKSEECGWQKEIREADLGGVGILGHSFDIIGFTAAMAKVVYVDPIDEHVIKEPILQNKITSVQWRNDKDIYEMIFAMVRYIVSAGEFDLIEVDGVYDVMSCAQRIKTVDNEYLDATETIIKKPGYVQYRLRGESVTPTKDNTITVPLDKVERCFWAQPGTSADAYCPARRVLPHIRLYQQIVRQFQRIAFSNGLAQQLLYLGIDDGAWRRDKEYLSQFDNPDKAIPPVANDVVQTGKEIASGMSTSPFYVTMGPNPPAKLDLTVSFDEQARQQLFDSEKAIATGLNIPARFVLADQDLSHFVEAWQDEQFRNFGVIPPLKIVLNFLDKAIYSKYSQKFNIPAKLWYSYQHISRVALNPAQLIELFKVGAIGTAFIHQTLGIQEGDALLSAEDIRYRRELLTGDSGLQQEQLANRDAQRQGIEKNAVSDITPLPDGKMRQSDTSKPAVTSALKDEKKN